MVYRSATCASPWRMRLSRTLPQSKPNEILWIWSAFRIFVPLSIKRCVCRCNSNFRGYTLLAPFQGDISAACTRDCKVQNEGGKSWETCAIIQTSRGNALARCIVIQKSSQHDKFPSGSGYHNLSHDKVALFPGRGPQQIIKTRWLLFIFNFVLQTTEYSHTGEIESMVAVLFTTRQLTYHT